MLFVSHLAANRTAFCAILPCVQHQNALHLAPKRKAFSTKTHSILLQIASKLVQMAALSNKNSFCRMHMPPLFCIKTNLRENRFFAARLANGDEKGSHNVKIFTKNQTKTCGKHSQVGYGAQNMQACNDLRERLWGMPLTGNGNSLSWNGKSNRALTSGFQFVETALNNFRPIIF